MDMSKFKICNKVITLQEDEELTNLLRNDDAFIVQFFEKTVREGRLQQFWILCNGIDNLEIIRLEEDTTVYNHYGDTEMDTEKMSHIESPFEESRDIVGLVSTEKEITSVSGESSSSHEQMPISYEAHDGGTSKRKHKSRSILEEIKQLRQIRENELELKKQKETERKKFRSELLQLEREKLESYKERNNLFKKNARHLF
ncbi:hypothetical protein JTB14_007292 [Gonioctena quinquepunctata]|nr:hypothetical protein JTB14_007292 [Gonioctena quinquepunctata]